jgi:hypothetical protein
VKVPEHLEELVWQVADANDPVLDADFETRYPDFAAEMRARRALSARLKAMRPAEEPIPDFQPREKSDAPEWRERAIWAAAAGLVAISVVAASFGAAAYIFRPTNVEPQKSDPPVVVVNPPAAEPNQETPAPQVQEPAPQPSAQEPPPAPETPFDRLITFRMEQASLSQVLAEVARQAGLSLESAPGMPDPIIEASYTDSTAREVLRDLGRNFGFTALEQGRSSVLVIPATGRPTTPPPTGPGQLPDISP